jgi:ParB-like chromosome segregation protein Spo0J
MAIRRYHQTVQIERVPLSALHPAPWNPRIIKEKRFEALCRSIAADPTFIELRPILATKEGEIYAGNMRFRAVQHLSWETVPAIFTDISDVLAKERALKDNNEFGEYQDDELATLIDELQKQAVDVSTLGFPDNMLDMLGVPEDEPETKEKHPLTCPQCGHSFDPNGSR